jgi:hypothetical protein
MYLAGMEVMWWHKSPIIQLNLGFGTLALRRNESQS